MITRLTKIKNFWTYYYVTVIDKDDIVTLCISESELHRIKKRSQKKELYKKPASFVARLVMAFKIIVSK